MDEESKKVFQSPLRQPRPAPTVATDDPLTLNREHEKRQLPWSRVLLQGKHLLRHPRYNKGLAFSARERRRLALEGLLPPHVADQDEQLVRVTSNARAFHTDLERYSYLNGLALRNQMLFYRALEDNLEEFMPVIYTPTVGLACQRFGNLFQAATGLYIDITMRGRVADVLENWPEDDVRAICITDGERILGLGDLGCSGMGIPIGKLQLYTAAGGINPRQLLPVMLDVGTDNEELLQDPMYNGLRIRRVRGAEYTDLLDEFLEALKVRFGPHVLVQFEDFGNRNAQALLERYQDKLCTFNDDIQGTASVVVAGLLASHYRTGKTKLADHRYVIFGAGEAGLGIAQLLYEAQVIEGVPEADAKKNIFLVDSRGLITVDRPSGGVSAHKAEFAVDFKHMGPGLEDIVREVEATALIGVTAQAGSFTDGVIRQMARNTGDAPPIIFPLSNPTDKAECTFEAAIRGTDGNLVFASGSPFQPVEHEGKTLFASQGNNAYVFPGVGLAVIAMEARRITNSMFYTAAKSLSRLLRHEDRERGLLYPPLDMIRRVSAHIAADVAEELYEKNLATYHPKPAEMVQFMYESQWSSKYPMFVHSN